MSAVVLRQRRGRPGVGWVDQATSEVIPFGGTLPGGGGNNGGGNGGGDTTPPPPPLEPTEADSQSTMSAYPTPATVGLEGKHDPTLGRNLRTSDLQLVPGGTLEPGTYVRKFFQGGIRVKDNVRLVECYVRGNRPGENGSTSGTLYPVRRATSGFTGRGVEFIDTTIDGGGYNHTDVRPSGWGPSTAVETGLPYRAVRVLITGCKDGIKPQGNSPAQDPYDLVDCCIGGIVKVWGTTSVGDSHSDLVQIAGSGTLGGVVLDHCNFIGRNADGEFSNAGIQFGSFSAGAVIDGLRVIACRWDGLNYGMRCAASTLAAYRNTYFGGNEFGLDFKTNLVLRDGSASDGSRPSYGVNRYFLTGVTGFGDSVTAGQAIDPATGR